jgi:hypothetical protein
MKARSSPANIDRNSSASLGTIGFVIAPFIFPSAYIGN